MNPRKRQADGCLQFLGLILAFIVVAALIIAASIAEGILKGASLCVLGGGMLFLYREFGEVLGGLMAPGTARSGRVGALLFGYGLLIAGLYELFA